MKKVILLILIFIYTSILFGCNNNTNNEKEDTRNLSELTLLSGNSNTITEKDNTGNLFEVANKLGLTEYKEIKAIEDRDVFVSDSLQKTYENYVGSEDENLLIGLEPIDIFRLNNTAVLNEKYDAAASLINYPSDIDKDEFLKEWKQDNVAMENEKKQLKSYFDKKSEVYQVIIDGTTSFIVFINNDQRYRLEWVDPGVWKIGWLARQ